MDHRVCRMEHLDGRRRRARRPKASQGRRSRKRVVTLAVAGLVLASPAGAQERSGLDRTAAIAFDIVVLRPFGILATAAGAALFVPAGLLAAPGGRAHVEETFAQLVGEPFRKTFRRPLGDN